LTVDFSKDVLTMEIELLSGTFLKSAREVSITESSLAKDITSYPLSRFADTTSTLIKTSWLMEFGIKEKFIADVNHNSKPVMKTRWATKWADGDTVMVQSMQCRPESGLLQQHTGDDDWHTAIIMHAGRDASPLQRLQNVVCGALEDELGKNNPAMERKAHWPELYSICYNWPELHDAILARWETDSAFRAELREPIGDFLESDYELWDDADDWELDADSIEAIYEVCGREQDGQDAQLSRFAAVQTQRRRLSAALARYYRRSLRHNEHQILQEKAQVQQHSTDSSTGKRQLLAVTSTGTRRTLESSTKLSQIEASEKDEDKLSAISKQLAALHNTIEGMRASVPEISEESES